MMVRACFVLGAVALVAGGCRADALPARTEPPRPAAPAAIVDAGAAADEPYGGITLRTLKMLDAKNGWALALDGRLFRTEDGATRFVVTAAPRLANQDVERRLAVLDRVTAWLVDQEPRIRISMTSDGGVTWRQLTPALQGVRAERISVGVGVDFFDARHAWLRVQHIPGKAIPTNQTAFTTDDAGQHWTLRGTLATTGTIVARTALDAWMLGRTELIAKDLYRTSDGGRSWRKVALEPPRELAANGVVMTPHADPVFWGPDRARGAVLAVATMGPLVLYVTSDGGETWRPTKPYAFPGRVHDAAHVSEHGAMVLLDAPGGARCRVARATLDGTWTDGGELDCLDERTDSLQLASPDDAFVTRLRTVTGPTDVLVTHDGGATWKPERSRW
jgi:photosystem II stability/assembly factor-like uncharacterized protein